MFDDWLKIDSKKFVSADGENYFCSTCLKFGNCYQIKLKHDGEHSDVCKTSMIKNITTENEFDQFIKDNSTAIKGYIFNGRKYLKLPNENYFNCNLCLINKKFVKIQLDFDGKHSKKCEEHVDDLVGKENNVMAAVLTPILPVTAVSTPILPVTAVTTPMLPTPVVKAGDKPMVLGKNMDTPKLRVTTHMVKSELDENLTGTPTSKIPPPPPRYVTVTETPVVPSTRFIINGSSTMPSQIPPKRAAPVAPIRQQLTTLLLNQTNPNPTPRNIVIPIMVPKSTPKTPQVTKKRKLPSTDPLPKQTNLSKAPILPEPIASKSITETAVDTPEESTVSPDSDSCQNPVCFPFTKKIKRQKFTESLFVKTDLEYKLAVRKDTVSSILIVIKDKNSDMGWKARILSAVLANNCYSFACNDCPSNAIMARMSKDGLLIKVGHTERCTPTKKYELLLQEVGREIDFDDIKKLKK
uniref:Uncharacterized protein n=1 Tax=Panagrolaimus sp. JU765 TaxID=591449 RepID=A0AC34PZR5_9BILA